MLEDNYKGTLFSGQIREKISHTKKKIYIV